MTKLSIEDAIIQRHSCRAFTEQKVSDEQIHRILKTASHSPSGANTQPWQIAVVTGTSKHKLQQAIQTTFTEGNKAKPDYTYYPEKWQEPYSQRRKACGLQLYESLDIKRQDIERRRAQWAANYRAFDAPVMIICVMDDCLQTGSYLDYGMFIQSFMLAAQAEGLATCPQAALAEYPDIIRQTLNYPKSAHVICGIALGYEQLDSDVNQYRTPREPVSNFTQFFD